MKTIYTGCVLYQKGAVTKVIKGPLSIVINVAILEAPLREVTFKPISFPLVNAFNFFVNNLKPKQNFWGGIFLPPVKTPSWADTNWNDRIFKISQSNGKCDHTLSLK